MSCSKRYVSLTMIEMSWRWLGPAKSCWSAYGRTAMIKIKNNMKNLSGHTGGSDLEEETETSVTVTWAVVLGLACNEVRIKVDTSVKVEIAAGPYTEINICQS